MLPPAYKSGPWIGFYAYADSGQKHLMDLNLRFHEGKIEGEGADSINTFTIEGFYDSRKMTCGWKKIYPVVSVDYYGHRDGMSIWGQWKVNYRTGGFHIWPQSEDRPAKLRGIGKEVPADIVPDAPLIAHP